MFTSFDKLIAAIVGVGVTWLQQEYGIDLSGESSALADALLKIGTPLLVWAWPNKVAA